MLTNADACWRTLTILHLLHYLIHTCSWDELRRICVDLEATIERELSEGLETGFF
jgi:hypothetical protein